MKTTVGTLKDKKQRKEKITMLTAYDYLMAKILDEAGIDLILVGDSLGMVILGYNTTIPVTLEDVLYHTKAVARGVEKAMVVADMPFLTYQADKVEALRNAARFLQEGGAQGVKIEGGVLMAETVDFLVRRGIPVMGHIGLTPQSVNQLGGFKVQGKDIEQARQLIKDAQALDEAGVFSIVLECIPYPLARMITEKVSVPTIGIGAGPYCDGQVLVIQDLLGYFKTTPRFVKKYAEFGKEAKRAVAEYIKEVREGKFPTMENSYPLSNLVLEELEKNENS